MSRFDRRQSSEGRPPADAWWRGGPARGDRGCARLLLRAELASGCRPPKSSQTSCRPLVPLLAAFLLLGGCGEDFEKPSVVKGLRVLAIAADPPSVAPDGTSTLTPLLHAEDPSAIERTWSLCAITKGPTTGYECAVPEVPLGGGETVEVDVAPLVAQAQAAAKGTGFELDLAAGETIFVRLVVQVKDERVESVKRLTITTTEPRNANPGIAGLTRDGEAWSEGEVPRVAPGATIRIVPEPAKGSAQPIVDPSGAATTEALLYAWFATAGEMKKVFSFDDIPENDWIAPALDEGEEEKAVTLWVVVRDGRGGTSWIERTLTVAEPDGGAK